MVAGNPQIKMTTSIIDYIFRELAISYLDRQDLAQVSAEDLQSSAIGDPAVQQPDFSDEEIISERMIETKPQAPMNMNPKSSHISNYGGGSTAPAGASANPVVGFKPVSAAANSLVAKAREAKMKGYEGDPCRECGQFTMVRNGTCLKCDACGTTSGCS
jgi:ribonucleoside-diphosphate reductase alpha chain